MRVCLPLAVDRRGRLSLSLLLALCLAAGPFAVPGGAVVIDRVGGGNTTAPADDPGWNNVGAIWIGGGVYIGNGWVLTANHIGSGSGFTLGGTTYQMIPGTGHQLTNNGAAGKTALTDLYMFQVASPPSLPWVSIAATGPSVGDSVTLIGRGRDQQANYTYWSVNTSVNPYVWTETTPSNANAAGFKTNSTQTMRWGTNSVDTTLWVNDGLDVHSFTTTFDYGVSSNEAQVVHGDSGGGVFVKQGGLWSLAGIIIAQGIYSGQPGGTNTAVFGDASYIADLSFYRSQIVAIAVPEPAGIVQIALAASVGGLVWWGRRGVRRSRSLPH